MTTIAAPRRLVRAALLAALAALPAQAGDADESAAPAAALSADPAAAPTLMRRLADDGLHDLRDESWNAYGQVTYISSWKPSFPAAYTNLNGSPNSLSPGAEHSFTATATLYLGVKLWPGGEAYFVPEIIAERPFSELRGLAGAIQNFELQKTGGEAPQIYRSRAFLRHTFGFGGGAVEKASDQMQLGAQVDRRRLVLTAGNFSILDVFDRSAFTGDPRQQFLSMGFMTHAAWDFASDARGYSWGAAAEVYLDDWVFRASRISPPINPNQLPVELRLDRFYGDAIEIEHQHTILDRDGAVRLLAFRNREVMGRFDEAVAAYLRDPAQNAAACSSFNYGSANGAAPDLCWVRRPNVKIGLGVSLEQHLTSDAGVFLRALYADGQTEVQAYTSADRSLAFGAQARGSSWGRPRDSAGVGLGIGSISHAHVDYLRRGGIDGFVGDGNLRPAAEVDAEAFYSVNVLGAVWLTGDYQRIWNPAFNADRGPVHVFGLRVHAQY